MKVGDYVRTHWGEIAKIIKIEDFIGTQLHSATKIIFLDKENRPTIKINDIKKYTSNKIELLELGDYVNGYPITSISNSLESIYIDLREDLGGRTKLYEDEIKSIITHEQIESMEYKVKE